MKHKPQNSPNSVMGVMLQGEKSAKPLPRGASCQPDPQTPPSHGALPRLGMEATEPTWCKDVLGWRTEMGLSQPADQTVGAGVTSELRWVGGALLSPTNGSLCATPMYKRYGCTVILQMCLRVHTPNLPNAYWRPGTTRGGWYSSSWSLHSSRFRSNSAFPRFYPALRVKASGPVQSSHVADVKSEAQKC